MFSGMKATSRFPVSAKNDFLLRKCCFESIKSGDMFDLMLVIYVWDCVLNWKIEISSDMPHILTSFFFIKLPTFRLIA